tara:strand:- start:221 stop:694 length:474 start_codon:yes stop_codon:yes gene_type:complete
MNKINLVLLAIMSLFLVGCGSQTMTGDSYSGNQARKAQTLKMGQIESVKGVEIKGENGGVGALAGGAIGGIAASNIGGGKMSIVSAIVGAVAGGVIGDKIEKNVNTLNGQELTVKLSNDTLIVVTQEIDKNVGPLRAGDKVRVLTSSNGTTRVQLAQ